MKKYVLSLVLSAFIVATYAQDSVYYYYGSEKIYLERDNTVKFVKFTNETAARSSRLLDNLRSQKVQIDTLWNSMYVISGDFNQKSIRSLLTLEQGDNTIRYISDRLVSNGRTMWESDGIIVKFSPDADVTKVLESNYIPYKEYKRLGSNPQTYWVTV